MIRDGYMLITDGRCYLDGTQFYGNGTTVLTLRRKPAGGDSE